MNRCSLLFCIFLCLCPILSAKVSRRIHSRRASMLSHSSQTRREQTRATRQLMGKDKVKSLREGATDKEALVGSAETVDLDSFHDNIPEISVWKLVTPSCWREEGEDLADASLEMGYMKLVRLPWLELDARHSSVVDPLCFSSVPMETANEDVAPSLPLFNPNAVFLNTTICPAFDVVLHMVNSISTRIVFTSDGELIPFEIVGTDYVGKIDDMVKEAEVTDLLKDLESLQFKTQDYLYDYLILNGELRFDRIPNCVTLECFGEKVFSDAATFWSLEAYRSSVETTKSAEWTAAEFDVGVWIETVDREEQNNETVNIVIEPQQFGYQLNKQPTVWKLNLLDGSVVEKKTIEQSKAQAAITSMNKLESIVSTATSVTFDLSDIPFSLQISSETDGDLVLYLSYIGEKIPMPKF